MEGARHCGAPISLRLSQGLRFSEKHRVVTFHHGSVKSPGHALAHMWRWRGRNLFRQARLLRSELARRGDRLVGRRRHVEQHFTEMRAAGYAANVGINGFTPPRTQGAAHQFVHVQRGTVTFWVGNVSHVGDHIVNFEVVVYREANVQAVNGLTRFQGALARDDEVVGFDICQSGFNVP